MKNTPRTKRPRAVEACVICRTRKNRCDEQQPCSYCSERDLVCTYDHQLRQKQNKNVVAQTNVVNSGTAADRILSSTGHKSRYDHAFAAGEQSQGYLKTPPWSETIRNPLKLRSATASDITPSALKRKASAHTSSERMPTLAMDPGTSISDAMDMNAYTRNFEFYGEASLVKFLRQMDSMVEDQETGFTAIQRQISFATLLHNTDLPLDKPRGAPIHPLPDSPDYTANFYFRVARRFLDAYFSNIHHIQPIFQEENFLTRCEDLWFGRAGQQPGSFVALYYAILSLGSLIHCCEERLLYGMDRFAWSRRLSSEASKVAAQLGHVTNLEIVQYYYMMAKVCQHELNPHIAYLYSGESARAALASGLNRYPLCVGADPELLRAVSRTWWAVYCLDMYAELRHKAMDSDNEHRQTSFALGRPDSLGPDEFHTQLLPEAFRTGESDITMNLKLYARQQSTAAKVAAVHQLENDVQNWYRNLPQQFTSGVPTSSLKFRRQVKSLQKQSITIRLRYLSLRMVIHAAFLNLQDIITETATISAVSSSRRLCFESATAVIDLIWETFRCTDFFQTWWYNSTYVLFAVSILVAGALNQSMTTILDDIPKLHLTLDRAIEVLDAMNESTVTKNAIPIIRRQILRAKQLRPPSIVSDKGASAHQDYVSTLGINDLTTTSASIGLYTMASTISQSSRYEQDFENLNWTNDFPIEDTQQRLIWTEWANEMDVLGYLEHM